MNRLMIQRFAFFFLPFLYNNELMKKEKSYFFNVGFEVISYIYSIFTRKTLCFFNMKTVLFRALIENKNQPRFKALK